MSRIVGLTVLALPCFQSSLAAQVNQPSWNRVSSFQYDWNRLAQPATFILEREPHADVGDFNRIRIQVPGHKDFVLTTESGWVKWNAQDTGLSSKEAPGNKQLLKSDYLLFLNVSPNRVAVFLFGFAFASSPGSLHVLELTDKGEVAVVFQGNEFALKDVQDLDKDGVAEVVGYPCLSETWGNGLLTYDPFNVYKLSPIQDGAQAELSLALSEQYNLTHYYGWAGPKCSEDLAVVVHPPNGGKPQIMKAKEAEKLVSGKN